ncbi:MAG: hypothetical protein AAF593_14855, partial [Planctomycetota bacterium]
MDSSWLLLLAVLAPGVAGLATLCLPKGWITPRVLLAVSGPALAFVLVLSHLGQHGVAGGVVYVDDGRHETETHAASDETTHAPHDEAHTDEHGADDKHSKDRVPLIHPNTQGTASLAWVPSMNLSLAFLADGLGGFFALLVSGIGVLIVLYARGYFGNTEQAQRDLFRFYPTLGFFATAMMGVVLADYTLLTL